MVTFFFYYSIMINNKVHRMKVLVESKKSPSRSIREDILSKFFLNECPIFPSKMKIGQVWELHNSERVPNFIISISTGK